jgi:hypothetical protein
MPTTLLRYRWRYFDPVRKKNCTIQYHATAEEMRKQHPDAVPVPGSEQVLELPDDALSNSMARFQIGVTAR